MSIGLVGRKCGMTRIFTEEGGSHPVTVIEFLPNRVVQVKTKEQDGYAAIQVTARTVKSSKVTKPLAGHYAKASVEPGKGLWEFRANQTDLANLQVGSELTVELFVGGR